MKKVYMTPLTEVEIVAVEQSILSVSGFANSVSGTKKSGGAALDMSDKEEDLVDTSKLLESDDEELDEIW